MSIILTFRERLVYFVYPLQAIRVVLPGKATAAARAALPDPNMLHVRFFRVTKQYGCQCLGSLIVAPGKVSSLYHET